MLGFGGSSDAEAAPAGRIRNISDEPELERALTAAPTILYKHSHRCGLCVRAQDQIEKFSRRHPDVAILEIDVLASRPLSDLVAERFGVTHASPQAILVREGEAVWHASHVSVTAARLEEALV